MILDHTGNPIAAIKNSNLRNPDQWLIDWVRQGAENPSGVVVNERVMFSITTAFACVRNIAEDMAKLPLMVFRGGESEKKKLKDSSLYRMLHDRPDPMGWSTAFQFRTAVTADCALGNGYAYIKRNNAGEPLGMKWIDSSRVTPRYNSEDDLIYEVAQPSGRGGQPDRFPARDIFHLAGFGDGTMGWNIVQLFARTFGLAVAQETNQAAFFGNGSKLGGVLQHPGNLSAEAAKRLLDSFNREYSGSQNTNKTALLEEGMVYNPNTANNQEAQSFELRGAQGEEICRIWRMPPHKVQNLARAHFANIESQNIEYVMDCLMSYCEKWEQQIKLKLISPRDQETFAEHNLTGLLRGDSAARAAFYQIMHNIGVLTINEIRLLENMNSIGPNGDETLVQGNNTTTLERVINPPEPPKAIAPPAEPKPQVPPSDRQQAILRNHARLLAGELRRHLKVERDRVSAATKRGNNLQAWGSEFYEGHPNRVAEAILPIVKSYYDSIQAVGRN